MEKIANQKIKAGDNFIYNLEQNLFTDIDGDNLTYSAFLEGNDPLPSWLIFDPVKRELSGTSPNQDL